MKIGFILIILFFLIASSCQNNKVVKLSGEIKGVNSNPLLISDLKFMDSLDTLAVDTVFNITMDVDNACFRTLIFGSTKKEIFLAPGYSLKIFFDANNIYSSLSFDGEGTNENRIHDSISRSMNKINFDFIYNQPSDLAVKYINSLFSSYQKYFNRLVSVTNLDPLFIDFEKQKMTYFFATLKENIGSNAHISNPVFYSFFDTLYIENEKYLEISEYRNFLSSYIDFKANKILNWRDRSEDEFYDDYLDACLLSILQVKNKKIREYLFFSQISFFIETNGVKNLTKFYQYFTKYNTNYIYAKQIQIIFDRKQLLSKGKKAPDFTLTDIDGNRVSLLKFRGKYVYIDFWATWCHPCMKELPHLIKLESDYTNKNVVFISIALDEDIVKIKTVLREHKIKGINLCVEKGINSNVANLYQIKDIPHFILIDKKGKMINYTASTPSSNQIRKVLDSLLLIK